MLFFYLGIIQENISKYLFLRINGRALVAMEITFCITILCTHNIIVTFKCIW